MQGNRQCYFSAIKHFFSLPSIDVLIFVEHVDRELEIARQIARRIQSSGNTVAILHSRLDIPVLSLLALRQIPIKVGIYPSAVLPEKSVIYHTLRSIPCHIDLHWEQLLYKPGKETKRPRGVALSDSFYHIAWDEAFADFLRAGGVSRTNIIITGNPAFEILLQLREKQQEYKKQLAEEFGLSSQSTWLFLPMNYAWAFLSQKDLQYRKQLGYSQAILQEFPQYAKQCFKAFVHFVLCIKEKFNYNIIVRPHPSVTAQQYEEAFLKISGLQRLPEGILITHQKSAREWVAASDIVGSSWSTVAYDAFRIGKPAFLFTPHPRPEWLEVPWYQELIEVRSCEDFEDKYPEIIKRRYSGDINSHIGALERLSTFVLELVRDNKEKTGCVSFPSDQSMKRMWMRKWVASVMMRTMIPLKLHRIFFSRWMALERDLMVPEVYVAYNQE